jgi:hypothetical protein
MRGRQIRVDQSEARTERKNTFEKAAVDDEEA